MHPLVFAPGLPSALVGAVPHDAAAPAATHPPLSDGAAAVASPPGPHHGRALFLFAELALAVDDASFSVFEVDLELPDVVEGSRDDVLAGDEVAVGVSAKQVRLAAGVRVDEEACLGAVGWEPAREDLCPLAVVRVPEERVGVVGEGEVEPAVGKVRVGGAAVAAKGERAVQVWVVDGGELGARAGVVAAELLAGPLARGYVVGPDVLVGVVRVGAVRGRRVAREPLAHTVRVAVHDEQLGFGRKKEGLWVHPEHRAVVGCDGFRGAREPLPSEGGEVEGHEEVAAELHAAVLPTKDVHLASVDFHRVLGEVIAHVRPLAGEGRWLLLPGFPGEIKGEDVLVPEEEIRDIVPDLHEEPCGAKFRRTAFRAGRDVREASPLARRGIVAELEHPHVSQPVLYSALPASDIDSSTPDPRGHAEAWLGSRTDFDYHAIPFATVLQRRIGYLEPTRELDVRVTVLGKFHHVGVIEHFHDAWGLCRRRNRPRYGRHCPRVVHRA